MILKVQSIMNYDLRRAINLHLGNSPDLNTTVVFKLLDAMKHGVHEQAKHTLVQSIIDIIPVKQAYSVFVTPLTTGTKHKPIVRFKPSTRVKKGFLLLSLSVKNGVYQVFAPNLSKTIKVTRENIETKILELFPSGYKLIVLCDGVEPLPQTEKMCYMSVKSVTDQLLNVYGIKLNIKKKKLSSFHVYYFKLLEIFQTKQKLLEFLKIC